MRVGVHILNINQIKEMSHPFSLSFDDSSKEARQQKEQEKTVLRALVNSGYIIGIVKAVTDYLSLLIIFLFLDARRSLPSLSAMLLRP